MANEKSEHAFANLMADRGRVKLNIWIDDEVTGGVHLDEDGAIAAVTQIDWTVQLADYLNSKLGPSPLVQAAKDDHGATPAAFGVDKEARQDAERSLPTTDVRRQEGDTPYPDYDLREDEYFAADIQKELGLAEGVAFCDNCGHSLVYKPEFWNPKTKKKVSSRLQCEVGCKDGRYPLTVWLD